MFSIFGFGRTEQQKYKDLFESYKILQNDYDALREGYNSIQAENDRLRIEVAALREENMVVTIQSLNFTKKRGSPFIPTKYKSR